jgi:hypothetical protein
MTSSKASWRQCSASLESIASSSVCENDDNVDDDDQIEVEIEDASSVNDEQLHIDEIGVEVDLEDVSEPDDTFDDLLFENCRGSRGKLRELKRKQSFGPNDRTYSGDSLHSEPDDHIA